MASKKVKLREELGEDLEGLIWAPEKPYMLVKKDEFDKLQVSFYTCRADYEYAVKKIEKYGGEILYAAEVVAFKKIGNNKSGFGRLEEMWNESFTD